MRADPPAPPRHSAAPLRARVTMLTIPPLCAGRDARSTVLDELRVLWETKLLATGAVNAAEPEPAAAG